MELPNQVIANRANQIATGSNALFLKEAYKKIRLVMQQS